MRSLMPVRGLSPSGGLGALVDHPRALFPARLVAGVPDAFRRDGMLGLGIETLRSFEPEGVRPSAFVRDALRFDMKYQAPIDYPQGQGQPTSPQFGQAFRPERTLEPMLREDCGRAAAAQWPAPVLNQAVAQVRSPGPLAGETGESDSVLPDAPDRAQPPQGMEVPAVPITRSGDITKEREEVINDGTMAAGQSVPSPPVPGAPPVTVRVNTTAEFDGRVNNIVLTRHWNRDEVRLSFETPDLGEVTIEIEHDSATGEVTVRLGAQSQEALAKLDQHVPTMTRAFANERVTVRGIQVTALRSDCARGGAGQSGGSPALRGGRR